MPDENTIDRPSPAQRAEGETNVEIKPPTNTKAPVVKRAKVNATEVVGIVVSERPTGFVISTNAGKVETFYLSSEVTIL